MTFKGIRARAGPPLGYLWYFLLVFLWFFLENIYASREPVASGSPIEPLLVWGFRIAFVPLISAGLFGGIHERQQTPDISGTRAFLTGAKEHYWRFLIANLLVIIITLTIVFAIAIAFAIAGVSLTDGGASTPLMAVIAGSLSAVTLFCYAAIVVEHRLFRGLIRGVKTLLSSPYGLAIGIAWGALSAADNAFFSGSGSQPSLAINLVRAGVLAAARILAIAYALAIYKQARGDAPEEPPAEARVLDTPSTSSGDGWVRASFGFAFLAFIPLLNFVALVLGLIALRRKKRVVLRAAFACCMGIFFTIFYFLIIAGWIVDASSPSHAPGYAFLAEANANLKQQVPLLEQGSVQEIQLQLEQNATATPERHWTLDSISALAKYRDNDLAGALEDFRIAAEKNPDRSEFYYYYGIALLDDGQVELAATQFQASLAHEPRLETAGRYLDLIKTAYKPPTIASSLLLIVVLLILFTVHEYGHAYTAWKLGDNTAKDRGRLTLNPVRHLDLFGSIILPGILLLQQAGIIFGWAKPVPVNPANFQNPRKDQMRVSFAGPAVNLIVSMLCFVALGFLMLFVRIMWPETLSLNLATPFASVSLIGPPIAAWLVFIVVFLKQMLFTSLVLGIFNLLPIPPLDGSWILTGLLPAKAGVLFEKSRRFGFLILLLVVLTPVLDYVLAIPLGLAWGGLGILFGAMGLG